VQILALTLDQVDSGRAESAARNTPKQR
jgi:hypothetical protein